MVPTATEVKSDLSFGQLYNRSLPATSLSRACMIQPQQTHVWYVLENTLLSDVRYTRFKMTQVLAGFPITQTGLLGYHLRSSKGQTCLLSDCQVKAAPTVVKQKHNTLFQQLLLQHYHYIIFMLQLLFEHLFSSSFYMPGSGIHTHLR